MTRTAHKRIPLADCKSVLGGSVAIMQDAINHILSGHPEIAALGNPVSLIKECVEDPSFIVRGRQDVLIALPPLPAMQRFLAIFPVENDRVITAFITSKPQTFMRRGVVWQK